MHKARGSTEWVQDDSNSAGEDTTVSVCQRLWQTAIKQVLLREQAREWKILQNQISVLGQEQFVCCENKKKGACCHISCIRCFAFGSPFHFSLPSGTKRDMRKRAIEKERVEVESEKKTKNKNATVHASPLILLFAHTFRHKKRHEKESNRERE